MKQINFNLGTKVHCTDGQCGNLSKLVIDPDNGYVTDIIVEKGFLMTTDTVLPITLVEEVTDEQIRLSISSDDISRYPNYQVTEFEEPAEIPGQQPVNVISPFGVQTVTEPAVPMVKRKITRGIEAGRQVIEAGMKVSNDDGVVGKVDRVILDPVTGKITHIVIDQGLIVSNLTIIPIAIVESIYNDGIFVIATNQEIEQFPAYDPSLNLML
ncbi:MAG: hypothetical protein KDI79_08810 [Anaerolineae bacterium]|nr:hypothetical protein [Anaerolineae bacterium]